MTLHAVVLYACAVAVVLPGTQLVMAAVTVGVRPAGPLRLLSMLWGRPRPVAAGVLVAVMVAMALVQTLVPAVIPALERVPEGGWWRALTALLVQTSGWGQLVFNLVALAVIAPAAERRLGPVLMLAVFLLSGVAAQAVSMAGWSVHGGGDSVGICGLVGALATVCGRDPGERTLRVLSPLVPVAGVVLVLVENNHGMGIVVGAAAGALSGMRAGERSGKLRGQAGAS
ncbi:rhomboid family intramembrane serine protease [Streptomyces sp. NPDC046557]|uniref:rhomboid family intramembrane serine protease n=1 Tax=Streptomyces sp. NPDC046557 TaxID=3155372 RepID=UPI003409DA4E